MIEIIIIINNNDQVKTVTIQSREFGDGSRKYDLINTFYIIILADN